MDNSTLAVWIAAAALLLNLGQRIFGGGWSLSKNINAVETKLQKMFDLHKRDAEERLDAANNNFGETVAALKEHVRQVEFHVRDYYIRKDDFGVHMKSHDDLLRTNFASITQRLERIEKTLDEKK